MLTDDAARRADAVLAGIDPAEVVEVCRQLIRLRTENPPGDLREGADRVAAYLAAQGIAVQRFEPAPGRVSLVARTGAPGAAGRRPVLILNGHLDVVPAGDERRWRFPPFSAELADGFVWGRGASDMKGGLAALLVAFSALARRPDLLGGEVVLSVVPDEETGGTYGSRWLLEAGHLRGAGCLIAEPSGPQPTIGQKGSVWLLLRTRGEPAHGSLSPVKGRSAIREMARVIEACYELFERVWPLPPGELQELVAQAGQWASREGRGELAKVYERVTVNPGVVRGGQKVNVVAPWCEVELDLRVPWGATGAAVMEALRAIFARHALQVEVQPLEEPGEPNYTSPREPVVQALLEAVHSRTGQRPAPVLQYASSDARHFRRHGIPTLQYGPAELEGIHGYDERVPVEALRQAVAIYVETALRFFRREEEAPC